MLKEDLIKNWKTLELAEVGRYLEAKKQAHQAAQIVGAVGRCLLPHHPWDIFGNMEWLKEQEMWAGWSIPGRFECRAALRPADLSLHLISPNGHSFAEFALHGKSFQEGFDWMKSNISDFGIESDALSTALPYDLPDSPWAAGTPFDTGDTAAFADLSRSFSNSALVLDYVSAHFAVWQNVRTWPHHFDISTRRRFAKGDGHWHMGIGFGPGGDHNFNAPYWHLTCYPSDEVDKSSLPELPGDLQWKKDGWLGVVLLWPDVLKLNTAAEQAAQVLLWVEKGMQLLAQAKK